MSDIRRRHVTPTKESRHTYEEMTRNLQKKMPLETCDSFIWNESRHTHEGVMPHSDGNPMNESRDGFQRPNDPVTTWLIHMCAVTHSCVCPDEFICVPRLVHTCAVTRLYVWHDSCGMNVSQGDVSHGDMSHELCMWVWYECVTRWYQSRWYESRTMYVSVIWMCHKPPRKACTKISLQKNMNETRHIYVYLMSHLWTCTGDGLDSHTGWSRPIDALSCRSLSAKEPLIIGLFCGKWPIKVRHPMGLRHPVS